MRLWDNGLRLIAPVRDVLGDVQSSPEQVDVSDPQRACLAPADAGVSEDEDEGSVRCALRGERAELLVAEESLLAPTSPWRLHRCYHVARQSPVEHREVHDLLEREQRQAHPGRGQAASGQLGDPGHDVAVADPAEWDLGPARLDEGAPGALVAALGRRLEPLLGRQPRGRPLADRDPQQRRVRPVTTRLGNRLRREPALRVDLAGKVPGPLSTVRAAVARPPPAVRTTLNARHRLVVPFRDWTAGGVSLPRRRAAPGVGGTPAPTDV